MMWIFGFFAVLCGISNPLQSGSNSALNKAIESPVLSAVIVYLVGAFCLLVCVPFLGFATRGAGGKLLGVPWWAFIGGICNALFLICTFLITKKLGSATFTTAVVIAAVVTSLALDNFGLMGFAVRHATPLRLVGGALAVGGTVMIALF
jgi:transporter family-2 protein